MNRAACRSLIARVLALLGVALLVVAVLPATAGEVGEMTAEPSSLSFAPRAPQDGVAMTVSGPGEFLFEEVFAAGVDPVMSFFDAAGFPLPDGVYSFELRQLPRIDAGQRKRLELVRAAGDPALEAEVEAGLPRGAVQAGYFSLAGGKLVPDEPEPASDGVGTPGKPVTKGLASAGAVPNKALLTASDGVIRNSLCVGFDCPNSPSFSDSTILLMENNTRIKFADTSNSPFPRNDWEIEANSSSNGGANYLGFNDCGSVDNDGGCATDLVFAVESGARQSALYVEGDGDVGIGTSNPVLDLHIVTGNSPSVRLQQDGSSGFGQQSWDIVGNETNFFVRDATNGSRLPLRIRPGAPTSSIDIATSGFVGVGTGSPTKGLHIRRSDGNAAVRVEDVSAAAGSRNLGEFVNNGKVNLRFEDTASGNFWRYEVDNRFIINHNGDAIDELELQADGDLIIGGMLTQNSDRNAKQNIVPVDGSSILAKLAALPIAHWAYKDDPSVRHIGPMAQDFFHTFEVGATETGLGAVDTDGVALAAIQALNRKLEQELGAKDELIRGLEARLTALEARTP